MKWEEFVEACRQKEIECSPKQQEQFVRYAQLLQEWNEKMNLTAITEWEEVLEKHFYDSLVPFAGMMLDGAHLCDVGAGAGFPSLPLNIAHDGKPHASHIYSEMRTLFPVCFLHGQPGRFYLFLCLIIINVRFSNFCRHVSGRRSFFILQDVKFNKIKKICSFSASKCKRAVFILQICFVMLKLISKTLSRFRLKIC